MYKGALGPVKINKNKGLGKGGKTEWKLRKEHYFIQGMLHF